MRKNQNYTGDFKVKVAQAGSVAKFENQTRPF